MYSGPDNLSRLPGPGPVIRLDADERQPSSPYPTTSYE
jgi:hypothetical protein